MSHGPCLTVMAIVVILAAEVHAATYYVDNTCANNGDGSTTDCAASGGAAGAFNALPTTISVTGENSYLIKRGTTINKVGSANQVTNITGYGTDVQHPLTIGVYGSGDRPILKANMRAILFTSPAKFILLQSLQFSDMALTQDGSSVLASDHAVTADTYFTLDDVVVSNITDGSGGVSGQDCILIKGRHNTITDSTITGCSQDGIQFYGDYFTATGNTISNVSTEDVFGDTIQGSTDANYFYIADNTLDHSSNAVKQGFVLADASLQSDTGGGLFTRNTITMGVGSVAAYCIYTEQPNSVYLSNTCTHNGTRSDSPGIVIAASATGTTLVGNEVRMTAGTSNGIDAGANSTTVSNNTVIRSSTAAGYGIAGGTGLTGWTAQNNLVQGFTAGLSHQDSANYTEKNNLLYGNTSACLTNAGGARTCDVSTLTSNPLFIGSSDARLLASSPAQGAGRQSGLCLDVRGRPCNAPPDIGAYQSTSGDPAATRAVRN